MRVVDVCEFYAERGGGVKSYVNAKLRAGARAGHEVVVVAPGPRDAEERREGGRIVWLKSPPMPFDPRYHVLLRERAVHRVLDALRPDVVEGSSVWTGGWFTARWRGPVADAAAKVLVFHQDPVAVYPETALDRFVSPETLARWTRPYWRGIERLAERYDLTLTSGEWLAAKLARLGVPRAEAVPFGIDRARFGPHRRTEATRAALLARCGLGPDARLLVCVSRMHPEKRLGTLLEAFRRTRLSHRPVGLVIFGDGPLRPWIAHRAATIPGVHLAGYTRGPDELPDALASADALLHGSAAETYGLVVAEALVSGLPLVVPDRGGAADLAAPAYSETYPAGHPEAASRAIHRLLDRDPTELRAAALRGAEARVRSVDAHFDALFARYARLTRRSTTVTPRVTHP